MAGFLALDELFEGRHFDREVIVLCVRWYLRFKLSYRDLVEMMAERGLPFVGSHHHHALGARLRTGVRTPLEPVRPAGRPILACRRDLREDPRQVDVPMHRAVDGEGRTVDFRLSGKRDVGAAKAFLRNAMKTQGSAPRTITLDGYAASHRAVREMKADGQLPANTKVRSSKYLNNLIEQDHRRVKLRIGPMLGFKWFRTAAITIAGIELLRRIHKDQFDLHGLRLKDRSTPAVWTRCLQRNKTANIGPYESPISNCTTT